MPDVYSVVFRDIDSCEQFRVLVEWDIDVPPNFNSIVRRAKVKMCKYLKYKSDCLVFVSLRRM